MELTEKKPFRVCCGKQITPEKIYITTNKRFLGWSGIRKKKGQLYSEKETYTVVRWQCPECGFFTQSGIQPALENAAAVNESHPFNGVEK